MTTYLNMPSSSNPVFIGRRESNLGTSASEYAPVMSTRATCPPVVLACRRVYTEPRNPPQLANDRHL
ncbi:BZ3500_MvSof-1268-A1-R1_Chr1-3g02456 [Microbotryum saponariae]|uniref:BZ3500_MvSof-1268-A1-R1_Chr1-3g02456 protein n=1 Tax=Microbotryum saponariae TaxID=289078 RepID=A0A2X0L5L5_9BASI|nr:BZ3500_MvSof-1268-A1-R1_Chr1-3g02456 [Microbotryum saponariae]SCZ96283.1 BZ3501_MvSof-1269-A2-R1_Chr1-3g02059 [Microbotryum saponariae]